MLVAGIDILHTFEKLLEAGGPEFDQEVSLWIQEEQEKTGEVYFDSEGALTRRGYLSGIQIAVAAVLWYAQTSDQHAFMSENLPGESPLSWYLYHRDEIEIPHRID